MNNELTIHGKTYQKKELEDYCNERIKVSSLAWERDCCEFILEWLNDALEVKVKTSGSTGKPKEMYLSKQKMIHSANFTGKFFNFQKNQKALLCLSTRFIAGKMMIVRAFVWKLNLILVAPDGHPLKNLNLNLDFAAMIPLQVQNSLSLKKALTQVKTLLIGGGAINSNLENQLKSIKSTVCFHGYGMTETISHVALRSINGKNAKKYYTGIGNSKFSIDKHNCLKISNPQILESTITSNDVVRLISETEFEWKGRIDCVINSGGIKLFSEEIEKKIAPLIEDNFFVAPLPDSHLGEKLILVIEANKYDSYKEKKLSLKLKKNLSKYEQIQQIFYLHRFVRTANSKVQRKASLSKMNSLL